METRRLSVKLVQHGSHPGGGCIYLHNEWCLWVRVMKDRGRAEGFLELGKLFVGFRGPGQRLGLTAKHGVEGCCEETETVDETLVEIGESQESLQFINCLRPRPLPVGLHLPLVHLDTFWADDIAKELHGGTVELGFLKFQIEVVLPELLEDLRYVVAMFGQVPGVYKDVINVDNHEAMQELPEHLVHEPLEDEWGVS